MVISRVRRRKEFEPTAITITIENEQELHDLFLATRRYSTLRNLCTELMEIKNEQQ